MAAASAPLRLIINADDFGWSTGVNEAVCALHEEGLLTSTSLMVGCPAAAEAVRAARERPTLAVGLHMALVAAPSVLQRTQISHLVDASGWFDDSCTRAGLRYTFLPACWMELRIELGAQFAKFAEWGLPWSHIDSHRHFALVPAFQREAILLAREYGVPAWRVPEDDLALHRRATGSSTDGSRALDLCFRLLCSRQRCAAQAAGLRVADRCLGLFRTGRLDGNYLAALIRTLPSHGTYELHCHPSFETEAGRAEVAAIRSPQFRSALVERGVELTTYPALPLPASEPPRKRILGWS